MLVFLCVSNVLIPIVPIKDKLCEKCVLLCRWSEAIDIPESISVESWK